MFLCCYCLVKTLNRLGRLRINKANITIENIGDIVGIAYIEHIDVCPRCKSHAFELFSPQCVRTVSLISPDLIGLDPWGNSYVFELDQFGYIVASLGKDGSRDTDDDLGRYVKWSDVPARYKRAKRRLEPVKGR